MFGLVAAYANDSAIVLCVSKIIVNSVNGPLSVSAVSRHFASLLGTNPLSALQFFHDPLGGDEMFLVVDVALNVVSFVRIQFLLDHSLELFDSLLFIGNFVSSVKTDEVQWCGSCDGGPEPFF